MHDFGRSKYALLEISIGNDIFSDVQIFKGRYSGRFNEKQAGKMRTKHNYFQKLTFQGKPVKKPVYFWKNLKKSIFSKIYRFFDRFSKIFLFS